MKVLDKGHEYDLLVIDGEAGTTQRLTFVKRSDPFSDRFPGNTTSYPGSTLQTVLRACIERIGYLQNQKWCVENVFIKWFLIMSIWLLEFRAARRHDKFYFRSPNHAYQSEMCLICGHTEGVCEHKQ